MRRADFLRLSGLAVLALATAGCSADDESREIALPARRILVPAAAGGGYDLTARTVTRILRETGITARSLEVFNVPGGGGVLGLARLLAERGNGTLILAMGLGIVGSAVVSAPHLDPADATPLARVASEPGVVLVRAGSDLVDAEAMFARWRDDPTTLRVGGGSSIGGPDYLFVLSVARELGLTADGIEFVPYSGGGDVLTGLLTGSVDVGFAGIGEMRPYLDAGDVRALAVSAPTTVAGVDAPSLNELGVDVEFANWRGFVGPPQMPDGDRDLWIDAFRRLQRTPEWAEAVAANRWSDAYLEGEDFRAFLVSQREAVQEILHGP